MTITVDFTPDDTAIIEAQAIAANQSVEDFAQAAILKVANNAAYLARLNEAEKQKKEGRVVYKTMEELEAMAL